MRSLIFRLLLCVAAFAATGAHAQTPAAPQAAAAPDANPAITPSAQAVLKGTYGDWMLRCQPAAGTSAEQCALFQAVAAQDRPNVGLMVILLKVADQKTELLRVFAPLGVYLPSGLGLTIDGKNVGVTAFIRCVPDGCIAEAQLSADLLSKLRNGKSATFVIFQTPQEGIGVPVSLKGLGDGYDKLK